MYRIFRVFYALIGQVCLLRAGSRLSSVIIGSGTRALGCFRLEIEKGGKLELGDSVLLRSWDFKYHARITAPVKLKVAKEGHLHIGKNTQLNGCVINCSKRVIIGDRCLIASGVLIMDRNGHDLCLDDPSKRGATYGKSSTVFIGDDVWIGVNAVITKGTYIPSGTIIMANSVVSGNFQNRAVIGGVPAVVLKTY